MHGESLSTPTQPVSSRVRAAMVRALIEVGCPAEIAGRVVDEHAEVEPAAPGGPTLWLYDQGRPVVTDDQPDDTLHDTCRDLAQVLSEKNAEMVDRQARGESALVFWPLPEREARLFPKRGPEPK